MQDSSLFSHTKETAPKHFNHHKGRTKFQIFMFPECCTQGYLEIPMKDLHGKPHVFQTILLKLKPRWSLYSLLMSGPLGIILFTHLDLCFFPFLMQTAISPSPILLHCYYVRKFNTVFPHKKKLARKDSMLLAEVYPGIMPISNHFLVATSIPLFQFGHSVHSSSDLLVLP